ncbi:MAG: glycoside hydrolase family 25 protein [Oscillospiraceae bacterium]|nr:glycoside hydrolase family 25 protein [Oscillospiraceae bacterium]
MTVSPRLKKMLLPMALALVLVVCAAFFVVRRSIRPRREIITVNGNQLYVNKELLPNEYTPEDFVREGDRVSCPLLPYRTGVDVSSHQGEVDWNAVAGDGISFAMLRCGYRGYGQSGKLNADTHFKDNFKQAYAAGLDIGVYFFSQAISEEEAVEEARFVLEAVKKLDLTLPIAFDWEVISNEESGQEGARTDGLDEETVTACALAFCQTIQEAGYEAMVYCNSETGYFFYDIAQFQEQGLPIWFASFHSDYPNYYYHMDWWQYTDHGSVAGIENGVDLTIWPLERDPSDGAQDGASSSSVSSALSQ